MSDETVSVGRPLASIISELMRPFLIAFAFVFALGLATALVFTELGIAAGIAAVAATIVIILLMSLVGAAMANPSREGLEMLVKGAHYRIRDGARCPDGFPDFFRALVDVAPAGSFLALAGGAWDSEIRDAVSKATVHISDSMPVLAADFESAAVVPITTRQMEVIADLAQHHASLEIAMHFSAFTRKGPWLEWFDATDDHIAISIDIPEEAVGKFAEEIGAKWIAFRWIGPEFGR